MEISETAVIVGKVAAIDGRAMSDDVVSAWHEVIGHLSWPTAERATVYALQNPNVLRVEPKNVLAEVRRAISDLHDELDKQEERIDGFWRDKPVNFDEMVAFYSELWRRKPWEFQKQAGYSKKGYPVMRQLYGDELDVEVRKSARACGMTMPEPVFADEAVPF